MSPSTTPLPEGDRTEPSRGATHYFEPEKGKQNVEFKEHSTRTSSTVEVDIEKKEVPAEDRGIATDEEAAIAASAPKDSGDYPSGVKLAFIVVALVLSVFLFSLDQVGFQLEALAGV